MSRMIKIRIESYIHGHKVQTSLYKDKGNNSVGDWRRRVRWDRTRCLDLSQILIKWNDSERFDAVCHRVWKSKKVNDIWKKRRGGLFLYFLME